MAPSLEQIYRAHNDFVWRSLRALGVWRPAIDDAVQDVFLIAHRRLPDYDPHRGTMRAWLFGFARMVSRKHAEKRARHKHNPFVDVPGGTSTHRLGARPERVIARREAAALVERFLAGLETDQRSVFFLKEVEGMSAPEIATAVDRKLNTVYSRLRLARRKFYRFVAAEASARAS